MFFCAVEKYDSLLSITTEKLSTNPKKPTSHIVKANAV